MTMLRVYQVRNGARVSFKNKAGLFKRTFACVQRVDRSQCVVFVPKNECDRIVLAGRRNITGEGHFATQNASVEYGRC